MSTLATNMNTNISKLNSVAELRPACGEAVPGGRSLVRVSLQ